MKYIVIVAALLCGLVVTSQANAANPLVEGIRGFRAARAAAILNNQAPRRVQAIKVQPIVVQKVQAIQVQPYVSQFVAPIYSPVYAPVQAVQVQKVQAIQVQKVQAVQAHGCAAFFSSGY